MEPKIFSGDSAIRNPSTLFPDVDGARSLITYCQNGHRKPMALAARQARKMLAEDAGFLSTDVGSNKALHKT